MLLFCNVDEEGNLTNYIAGYRIIPEEQYDYFFFLQADIVDELHNYKVDLNTRELVLK